MNPRVDILDEPESLRKPFLASIALHAGVFGLFAIFTLSYEHSRVSWGLEVPGGGPGSVAVSPVKTLPLPDRSGRVNPLANESESRVPQAPKQDVRKKEKAPEPNAIPLRSKTLPKPFPTQTSQTRYRPEKIEQPNQVYSSQAPALVNPMIAKAGSGQIGVGANGPLGTQCGAYAAQLQQLVASKWRTGDIDTHVQTAPPAIFSFYLRKDGTIDGLQRKESSGNYQVDTSAERAILTATPFPPISCNSNGGQIEFWFLLKR